MAGPPRDLDSILAQDPTTRELRLEITHLRELLAEQSRGSKTALELQAKEYERRLGDLNHAHATAEARNAEYITKEAAGKEIDALTRRVDVAVDGLNKRVQDAADGLLRLSPVPGEVTALIAWKTEIGEWRSRVIGIAIGCGAVSGLVTALIARLIAK